MKYALALLLLLTGCHRAPLNKSIVMLKNNVGACTGFQIEAPSGKDYLITAGHCLILAEAYNTISVTTEDGAQVRSRVIALDASADLLLLEAVPNLRGFKIASADAPGEIVRIIGHGYALPLWEVDGKIIGDLDMVVWLETVCSAGAAPGHSGSPVIDPQGHVVGVLSTSNGVISGFVRLSDLQAFLKGY